MMIDSTEAKMGRLMKKLENIGRVSVVSCRKVILCLAVGLARRVSGKRNTRPASGAAKHDVFDFGFLISDFFGDHLFVLCSLCSGAPLCGCVLGLESVSAAERIGV